MVSHAYVISVHIWFLRKATFPNNYKFTMMSGTDRQDLTMICTMRN